MIIDIDTERKAFEAWVVEYVGAKYAALLRDYSDDFYKDDWIEDSWQSWLAAKRHAEQKETTK